MDVGIIKIFLSTEPAEFLDSSVVQKAAFGDAETPSSLARFTEIEVPEPLKLWDTITIVVVQESA